MSRLKSVACEKYSKAKLIQIIDLTFSVENLFILLRKDSGGECNWKRKG